MRWLARSADACAALALHTRSADVRLHAGKEAGTSKQVGDVAHALLGVAVDLVLNDQTVDRS